MNPERISVYIPCHNAGRFITACLEAVRAQSLEPAEIIVVNDGSTDRTAETAKRLGARVVDLPSHPGLAAARNAALRESRCELVASLDADCIADRFWLERLAGALRETGAAGAGGMLTEHFHKTLADRWRAAHMRQNWGTERLVNPPFLFGCNTLFVKRAIMEAGGYDERCRTNGEDVDLSLRLRSRGLALVYEPSAAVSHLKRDTVRSVLRADWAWGYLSSGDRAKYERASNIVYHNFTNARYRFDADLDAGRYRLMPLDILLFFLHTYWDIDHAARSGLLQKTPPGLAPRLETLTVFQDHLRELSENRFLRNPDAVSQNPGSQ